MMESTTVNHNLLQLFVSETCVRCKNISHLPDVIFFLESLGPFDNILTKFNGLPSGMDKDKNLFVLFEIIESHFVASFVKNVSDIFLFGKIVGGVFWIFDADEMNEQGDWPVVGIKIEEPIFAVYFQEVSDIVVIGKSGT
jgi:hypothetical protein